MLIAVDQKDRALKRACNLYILKLTALQSSDTVQYIALVAKPCLSIAYINFIHNTSQVF